MKALFSYLIICVGDIVNLTITDPFCYKQSKMHWNEKRTLPLKHPYNK